MAEDKKYLRAVLKESREALDSDRTVALSAEVQARLIASEPYRDSPTLVLYAAAGNEVATGLIAADSITRGRAVYYPRLESANSISLCRVRDPEELKPGAHGILEPIGGPAVAPDTLGLALICVPGVAFAADGARLGRGGGHYDRLLTQLGPQFVSVGLAYSFQFLDSLPQAVHDRRVDYIVTEFAVHAAAMPHSKSASWLRTDRGGPSRCLHC